MKRLGFVVFASIIITQIVPVHAAPVQVTGKALASALYGHEHKGTFPNGDTFDVSYDTKGVQYAGGKKTGTVLKATTTEWCGYTKKKTPDYCVLIYRDGSTYTSRDSKTPGVILGTFEVK